MGKLTFGATGERVKKMFINSCRDCFLGLVGKVSFHRHGESSFQSTRVRNHKTDTEQVKDFTGVWCSVSWPAVAQFRQCDNGGHSFVPIAAK